MPPEARRMPRTDLTAGVNRAAEKVHQLGMQYKTKTTVRASVQISNGSVTRLASRKSRMLPDEPRLLRTA